LKMGGPAGECVVAVGCAAPTVALIGPIVRLAGEVLVGTVTSGPTAPGRRVGIVHAGGNQIEEGHGVPLLLPMGGVSGIERAEGAMAGENVARQVEAAGLRCYRGKSVVPAAFVEFGLEGINPKRKWR